MGAALKTNTPKLTQLMYNKKEQGYDTHTQIANLANNVMFLPQAMTWFERIDAKKR